NGVGLSAAGAARLGMAAGLYPGMSISADQKISASDGCGACVREVVEPEAPASRSASVSVVNDVPNPKGIASVVSVQDRDQADGTINITLMGFRKGLAVEKIQQEQFLVCMQPTTSAYLDTSFLCRIGLVEQTVQIEETCRAAAYLTHFLTTHTHGGRRSVIGLGAALGGRVELGPNTAVIVSGGTIDIRQVEADLEWAQRMAGLNYTLDICIEYDFTLVDEILKVVTMHQSLVAEFNIDKSKNSLEVGLCLNVQSPCVECKAGIIQSLRMLGLNPTAEPPCPTSPVNLMPSRRPLVPQQGAALGVFPPIDLRQMQVSDVQQALRVLRARRLVFRPQIYRSSRYSRLCGCDVSLLMDNLQQSGSSKQRAVGWAMEALVSTMRSSGKQLTGVLTVSDGNHGHALAFVGYQYKVPVSILVPADMSPSKMELSKQYGANLIYNKDDTLETLLERGPALAKQMNLTWIHPYDLPHLSVGYATLAHELVQSLDLNTIIMPVAGGTMIAGVALYLHRLYKETGRKIRLIGVQPAQVAPLVTGEGQERGAGGRTFVPSDAASIADGGVEAAMAKETGVAVDTKRLSCVSNAVQYMLDRIHCLSGEGGPADTAEGEDSSPSCLETVSPLPGDGAEGTASEEAGSVGADRSSRSAGAKTPSVVMFESPCIPGAKGKEVEASEPPSPLEARLISLLRLVLMWVLPGSFRLSICHGQATAPGVSERLWCVEALGLCILDCLLDTMQLVPEAEGEELDRLSEQRHRLDTQAQQYRLRCDLILAACTHGHDPLVSGSPMASPSHTLREIVVTVLQTERLFQSWGQALVSRPRRYVPSLSHLLDPDPTSLAKRCPAADAVPLSPGSVLISGSPGLLSLLLDLYGHTHGLRLRDLAVHLDPLLVASLSGLSSLVPVLHLALTESVTAVHSLDRRGTGAGVSLAQTTRAHSPGINTYTQLFSVSGRLLRLAKAVDTDMAGDGIGLRDKDGEGGAYRETRLKPETLCRSRLLMEPLCTALSHFHSLLGVYALRMDMTRVNAIGHRLLRVAAKVLIVGQGCVYTPERHGKLNTTLLPAYIGQMAKCAQNRDIPRCMGAVAKADAQLSKWERVLEALTKAYLTR
ncbi:hypothetical protein KIPB_007742, partial [Kipferlia bialata]